MLALKKIRIQDFRSFVDEEIFFDESTTVIGPNEGGKTNILDAIAHFENVKPFQSNDLRNGTKNYPDGEIEIEYTFSLTSRMIPDLIQQNPILEGREFIVSKRGKIDQAPEWKSWLVNAKDIDKIIVIKTPFKFRKKFDKERLKLFEKALQERWFFKKPSLNLTQKPFPQLKKEKVIEILADEQKINKFLSEEIIDELRDNLGIYFWEYEESEFLKNQTPIGEFVQNPDEFPTLKNLFEVAGWDKSEFQKNLQSISLSDTTILLKKVEGEINKLIKKTWKQHSDLKIDLQRSGDILLLHLSETGSLTSPEIRSDGLKWFLSFLINFHAESESLSDFIILIDEPALNLHPRGQKDVLSELNELANHNQIIYTTHQTFMIDKNHPERVRVLTRESIKTKSQDYYFASKITNKLETKDIITDPLLREALGFNVSDISPLNEKNILVEGTFDRGLILLLNRYFPTINATEYSVIACNGASDIKRHANHYIGNGLKVFCLYDSDTPGLACYKDNSANAISSSFKTHLKLLDVQLASVETPEDLFPFPVFQEAVSEIKEFKGFNPVSKLPRGKQLTTFFDSKNLTREERMDVKHKLEDVLLKRLEEQLKQKKIAQGSEFVRFLQSLNEEASKSVRLKK